MFVVMRSGATEAEVNGVKGLILAEGLTPFENAGATRTVIAVVGELGKRREQLRQRLEATPGVAQVTPISKPYKLVSREFHPEDTVIRVMDTSIGDGSLTVMAGPCSVESRDQLMDTVDFVAAHGATIIRGGAFKPRSSPYSFQGLGVEGLRYLAEARERSGMPVITEVMDPSQVDIVAEYSDILQVGTRNMQNFSLLLACGRASRPVMLKRGFGATIEEWLMAAEYIASAGNTQRHPVRARHPDVRDDDPQHARPHGDPARPPLDPPAGDRRPVARDRQALARQAARDRRHRRRAPTGSWSRSTRAPTRPCPTPSSSSTSTMFASMMEAVTAVHEHVKDIHGDLHQASGTPTGVGA